MNEEKESKIGKIISEIGKKKWIQYLLVGILSLAVVLIFVFNFNGSYSKSAESDAVDVYVKDLENRLSKALSRVDGAGEVSVVITVESGMETVIATQKEIKETEKEKTTSETPILVNGKTVILKELYPKITGVLIVSKGADNIAVMRKLQQATISLLDININQIEILTMK